MRFLEVGTNLETIGVEVDIEKVIEGTSEIQKDQMTEEEAGIEMIEEDLGETEVKIDIEIETGLTPEIEGRREGIIITKSQNIL